MKVLVDTPIWSYALRTRKKEYQYEIERLESLIKDQRALIIGPIRQEILSGYSDFKKFKKLKEKLSYFENSLIQDSDYESAAEMCNQCRKKGIQGSAPACHGTHRLGQHWWRTGRGRRGTSTSPTRQAPP